MDNYIFITADGHPLPIADRLRDDGKNVLVGIVEDPPEEHTPDSEEKRQQLYDGILEKLPAEELLKRMESFNNKNEWFVMFDYGDLWPWSERVLEMGFTKGVFPTEEGYTLEKDRKSGKTFAKENYPNLIVADSQAFKDVGDAVEFLNDNGDKIYVLKSEGSEAETVVPDTPDPELASLQIQGALLSEKTAYEDGGFTLEEKITDPIEISPVMVFWNGAPLFSLVELENKGMGAGNIGRLTGGCQNLTIQTDLDCRLNQIAFPDAIYDLAAKQPGVGIYDAGLLFDGQRFCFTEFCSQRWGWDGIFSEISMCGGPARHFDLISVGENPLIYKYGASVRLFQTQPDSKLAGLFQDGYTMDWLDEASDHLFFYCIKREEIDEEKRFLSVGYRKDLGVATAASDYMEDAVGKAYAACKAFAMTGVYYRPQFDFLSESYPTSIKNRYKWLIKSGLI